MIEFFINGFLVFLLAIIAVIAIKSIKIFTTVMLAGAYSLISAIIFVSLDAVDVAFTEAAVGAGLSTVLYIAAMKHLPKRENIVNDNSIPALIVCIIVGCLLIWASFDLPKIGDVFSPIHQHVAPYYISNTKADMGIPNLVTSVLASYRGYDTLGETVVIFTAGLGVFLLLGDNSGQSNKDE
jgi:multicomponent Na+:H+ antiporter subunit B